MHHSTATAFLDPIRDRKKLIIETNAYAQSIIIGDSAAIGVSYKTNGVAKTAKAGETLLAAGAINAPKILMQSGIGDAEELAKHGIPCVKTYPVMARTPPTQCLVANSHSNPKAT